MSEACYVHAGSPYSLDECVPAGSPLRISHTHTHAHIQGYVPSIHVQVCCRLGPPGGAPKLFAPDEFGNVVSATDIKVQHEARAKLHTNPDLLSLTPSPFQQGHLGDCYLLGAMVIGRDQYRNFTATLPHKSEFMLHSECETEGI